jgi:hypothetical protein
VVVLEKRVYVYDLSNLNLVDQVETATNPTGKLLWMMSTRNKKSARRGRVKME